MAISDAERHRLHGKLDEVLGEESAATLMAHLPPSGWSDVATKRDIDVLGQRIDARFDAIEARFLGQDAKFASVDAKFESVDSKFDAMSSRFDATLERALREQTNRFLVMSAGLLTLLISLQEIVNRAIGS